MQNFLLLPGKKKPATVKRSYYQFHTRETMIDLVLEAIQAHQWNRKRTEAQVKSWAKPKPIQNTEPFRYPPAENPESSAVLCKHSLSTSGGKKKKSCPFILIRTKWIWKTPQPSFLPSPCAGVMTAYLYIISCLVISYIVWHEWTCWLLTGQRVTELKFCFCSAHMKIWYFFRSKKKKKKRCKDIKKKAYFHTGDFYRFTLRLDSIAGKLLLTKLSSA